MELTEDYILDGKISLLQPKNGYRVAIDPIILANFIDIKSEQSVLDVGCGVGAISLILKFRCNSAKIFAVDIDDHMCDICKQNSTKNRLKINVINVGVENMHKDLSLKGLAFDHVITNPPFFDIESSRVSSSKRLANFETIELSNWISCCLKRLKNRGTFSIIHNASRMDDILRALSGKTGDVKIIPVYPKRNSEAKRVIVRCTKGCRSQIKIMPPLIIHENSEKYSEVAEKMLRGT